MMVSNQSSHYKSKCIRKVVYRFYCMALFHSQTGHHVMKVFYGQLCKQEAIRFTKTHLSVLLLAAMLADLRMPTMFHTHRTHIGLMIKRQALKSYLRHRYLSD